MAQAFHLGRFFLVASNKRADGNLSAARAGPVAAIHFGTHPSRLGTVRAVAAPDYAGFAGFSRWYGLCGRGFVTRLKVYRDGSKPPWFPARLAEEAGA